MNEKNLKPFTSSQSREEAVKNGRKGGIASGKARAEKQYIRNIAQAILSGEYTTDGEKLSGEEILTKSIIEIISNSEHKHFMDMVKTLIQLTDSGKTPEEIKADRLYHESRIANLSEESNNE